MPDRNLYYLHELSDYKVASDYPDVRGWEIKDVTKRTIGKVDNLLVNKNTKRVVYLDVEVDQSIIEDSNEALTTKASEGMHEFRNKEGENHLIVPIGLVDIDEENKQVYSREIDYNTFRDAKRFSKGSMVDPVYELTVCRQFMPLNKMEDSSSLDDDFYNRKEFQSRYSNKRSL